MRDDYARGLERLLNGLVEWSTWELIGMAALIVVYVVTLAFGLWKWAELVWP